MRKITLLIIVALLLSACNPCKRLSRLCPVEVRDSITYIERITLDTLTILLPGDTTYIEVPVVTLNDLNIKEENTKQKIEIAVDNNRIKITAICKEDSLKYVIAKLETELSKDRVVWREREVPVKYVSTFRKVCTWGFIIMILLSAVIVYIKFKARILKFLK